MSTRLSRPIPFLFLLLAGALMLAAGCSGRKPRPEVVAGTPSTPLLAQEPSAAPSVPPLVSPTTEPSRSVFLPQVANQTDAANTPAATQKPSSSPTPLPSPTQTPSSSPTPLPSPTQTPTPAPSPTPEVMDLADWPALSIAEWPRPANDNGLCIHNIGEQYYGEENLNRQISRLKEMNIRWTVLLYGDENMLKIAAPLFRDAGIMVIWRRMLRADDRYYDWGRDIQILRDLGVEPYMQIYNEPSLSAEWDEGIDQARFIDNFISAVTQVYNAGGYIGVQMVDDDWLVLALQEIKRRGGEKVFGRMFLIPHPYGLNHPPDYTEDPDGVLGFLDQAKIVSDTIGFVPPIIAGEGGWKWNATDDPRYPPVDAERHRDYHLAVFNWFRTGQLSNGEPLPDTLLAFCPWLLSSKLDDSAWFDSFYGDHTPTIDAVKALPPFVRKFSWER